MAGNGERDMVATVLPKANERRRNDVGATLAVALVLTWLFFYYKV